ncbi:hypothetical protein KZP23_17275 [Echinicola marina]|uniref:hypothetical protein n=1 Tax=Echinicola marina TaxID=2859768 RepID=UPI001CF6EFE8|nr:hypothetical protein [Echinicola marina]UCS92433.1 hypothetical protein KZP23_17275 [Echinicola marina]
MNRLYLKNNFEILLIIVGTVLYIPLWNNGFSVSAGDDDWMLYNNPYVYSLDLDTISTYFTRFYSGQYSPLNTLLYGIIYYYIGMDAFAYHLMSLVLHILNSVLVFKIVEELTSRDGTRLYLRRESFVPFLTALLFLIHPIQVESVVWISASKIVLYSFFLFCGLLSYIRYVRKLKTSLLIWSLLFFVLGFGAKEQIVVFPFLLILLDYFFDRSFRTKKMVLEKLPFLILAGVFCLVSLFAQQEGFSNKLENEYYPFFERTILATYAFSEYLFKIFLPIKLSYWYSFPMEPGSPLPLKYYFYPLFIVSFFYFIFTLVKKDKQINLYILFGLMFFIINIFLTLHIVPMARGVFMADRYVYVGSIGLFFIFSQLIEKYVLDNLSRQKFIALIIYLFGLFIYTFWYIDYWNYI